MINIVGKRVYTYIFSAVCLALSVYAIFAWGLKLGRDFTGGALMEYTVKSDVDFSRDALCGAIDGGCADDFVVTQTARDDATATYTITYQQADEAFNQKVMTAVTDRDEQAVQNKSEFTGGVVSAQLRSGAMKALVFATLGILLYIAWAFKNISVPVSSWYYGVCAVAALVHDIVIVVGVFAALGHFTGITVEVPFIAAILTVLGYSVNDTIVVYDRIRENVLKTRGMQDFEMIVNKSLNETLGRSINTTLTVVFVLVALVIWGGSSLFSFSLALLIGIVCGAYSSIFVASGLVVTIYNAQRRLRGAK